MPSPRETLRCHYHYDPLDRLIANAAPNEPEHQRFYCKNRLATEIQGAVRYSIFQHDEQLLAQQQSQGGVPGTTLLATDQQRSVLNTFKANQPRQPIAYTPYGHHPVGSWLLSLLGFNGERPDSVTGCYLLGNGHRALNPKLMRFNSVDNLSPFGVGGINPYAYCSCDPINQDDRTGRSPLLLSFFLYKASRTITGIKPAQFLTLKHGISRSKALNFKNALRTNEQTAKAISHQQEVFSSAYNNVFPLSNTSSFPSLKNLSKQSVLNNNLPTHDIPRTLQTPQNVEIHREVLSYLRDRRYTDKAVLSRSNLQLLPNEISKSRNPQFKKIANQYRDQLNAIRSQPNDLHNRGLAKNYFYETDIY